MTITKNTVVYLAGSMARRDELRAVRSHLQDDWGYTVNARWLDSHFEDHEVTSEYLAQCATEDLRDIDACDVFVLLGEPEGSPNTRGGRMVEYGYALAKEKCIVICGRRETVFHHFEDGRIEYADDPALIPFAVKAWHDHIHGGGSIRVAEVSQ